VNHAVNKHKWIKIRISNMNCLNCGSEIDEGAVYCGNCGQQVQAVPPDAPVRPTEPTSQPVQTAQPAILSSTASVQAPTQPAFAQPALATSGQTPAVPGPAYGSPAEFHKPGGGKAIASFVLGVVGLLVWLVPILGLIVGILAVVFGTMSTKSGHRKLAISGVVLGGIAIALSLFFFAYNVQQLSEAPKRDVALQSTQPTSVTSTDQAGMQSISTPCFMTTLSAEVAVTKSPTSCSFDGVTQSSDERWVVKALTARPVGTDTQLSAVAKDDMSNVLSLIPGGYIVDQELTSFAGKTAYAFQIASSEGQGSARISYIRHTNNQYNLFIVGRFVNVGDDSLSPVEVNWKWL
jgi:hypothetical protein